MLKAQWDTASDALDKLTPTERFFTKVYQQNTWGGEAGEYYSGEGSADSSITDPYVDMVTKLSDELNFSELHAVDLGCGDMRVGSRVNHLFASYIGGDIVKDLIASHQKNLASPRVEFSHLNLIKDPLPPGDFCMIRQVLQHLSNAQIQKILPKLKQYDYVLITEHIPRPSPDVVMNIDIPQSADVRLSLNSGVFLTAPPFNIPEEAITTILEVPYRNTIIRTVLYRPKS